jgi:hypothetical protein
MKSLLGSILIGLALFACEKEPATEEAKADKNIQVQRTDVSEPIPHIHKESINEETLRDSLAENSYYDTSINSFRILFTQIEYSKAAAGATGLKVSVYQNHTVVMDTTLNLNYGGDLEYSLLLEKLYYDKTKGNCFVIRERLNDDENNINDSLIEKKLIFSDDFSSFVMHE